MIGNGACARNLFGQLEGFPAVHQEEADEQGAEHAFGVEKGQPHQKAILPAPELTKDKRN